MIVPRGRAVKSGKRAGESMAGRCQDREMEPICRRRRGGCGGRLRGIPAGSSRCGSVEDERYTDAETTQEEQEGTGMKWRK